jgi:hypothetical protein
MMQAPVPFLDNFMGLMGLHTPSESENFSHRFRSTEFESLPPITYIELSSLANTEGKKALLLIIGGFSINTLYLQKN